MSSTTRPIRIQVDRLQLIEAVRKHDVQCQKDYERALKQWQMAKQRYPKKLADAARKLSKDILVSPEKYADAFWDSYQRRTFVEGLLPKRPPTSPPIRPTGSKRLVEMLELGATPKVALSEEQYRMYMASCAL